jgi:hypothetical protein
MWGLDAGQTAHVFPATKPMDLKLV